MKAYLITPAERSVEPVNIDTPDDIAALIGFNSIAFEEVGAARDRLYFDEECFLRGSEGRFQVDNLIPLSGKAVLIGSANGDEPLRDVGTELKDLRSRIKYL